jgi:AcrR family transcriptional regulator
MPCSKITPEALLSALPRGRHSLPPRIVAENQRTRIFAALIQALAGSGRIDVSVRSIVAIAHISRPTFYELFENKEDAANQLLQLGFEQLTGVIEEVRTEGGDMRMAFLRFAEEAPPLLQALVVGGPIAAPETYSDGMASLLRYVDLPDENCRQFVRGGIASVIRRQLSSGESVRLPDWSRRDPTVAGKGTSSDRAL